MTIFPLGRHYLIQSASFRPDGNLFTRNIFTWTTILLGWSYFHSDDYISTWIIISSFGQQTFTRPVNFHSTVNFHSDGKLFTRISDWKHSPILICLSGPHMTSDWDELYMKIDRLDETKLFCVEGFSIKGRLEGRIAHALHQTLINVCLVSSVTFWSLACPDHIDYNFCIWTRIEMIYIWESMVLTRRRQFL